MPVRSLNSSVLRWPALKEVESAVHKWARGEVEKHDSLVSLGYFGSYAREEAGVGSDLDLVAIVESSRSSGIACRTRALASPGPSRTRRSGSGSDGKLAG
jgi:hypothetical protein